MWAALSWIAKVALKVVAWAALHPVKAIVVGLALGVGGAWLSEQKWAGAAELGGLVGTLGITVGVHGIGGWIARRIALAGKELIEAAGREIVEAFSRLTSGGRPDAWIKWSHYWRP